MASFFVPLNTIKDKNVETFVDASTLIGYVVGIQKAGKYGKFWFVKLIRQTSKFQKSLDR